MTASSTGQLAVTVRSFQPLNGTVPSSGAFVVHLGPSLSAPVAGLPIACADLATWSAHHPILGLQALSDQTGALRGSATLLYNPSTQTLTVHAQASGLAPFSQHAAHIHLGSCAAQGPVRYMLPDLIANAAGNVNEVTMFTGVTSPPPQPGGTSTCISATATRSPTPAAYPPSYSVPYCAETLWATDRQKVAGFRVASLLLNPPSRPGGGCRDSRAGRGPTSFARHRWAPERPLAWSVYNPISYRRASRSAAHRQGATLLRCLDRVRPRMPARDGWARRDSRPPSTGNTAPVVKELASLARKVAAAAISDTSPLRLIGSPRGDRRHGSRVSEERLRAVGVDQARGDDVETDIVRTELRGEVLYHLDLGGPHAGRNRPLGGRFERRAGADVDDGPLPRAHHVRYAPSGHPEAALEQVKEVGVDLIVWRGYRRAEPGPDTGGQDKRGQLPEGRHGGVDHLLNHGLVGHVARSGSRHGFAAAVAVV